MKAVFPILICIGLMSCSVSKEDQPIIHSDDYAAYLNRNNNTELANCTVEMEFWQKKLADVPTSETYRTRIASLYASRFMLTGRIEDIISSDSLYHVVQAGTAVDYASLHRSLAANCITQHQFREAYVHIKKALAIGDNKASSYFMLADVDIELGDYKGAGEALQKINHKHFFPYLIRKAKLKDHAGDLDSAIILMETALSKINDNASLSLWTKSNLADMYGHAGRVQEAYQNYVNILKQNPDYDYALKGIAWIAYSHDHNYREAKRILNHINEKRATPDMHLLLAKIAASEHDKQEEQKQLALFISAATDPRYGNMYNKYLALLEAETLGHPQRTIELAQIEIRNRPTPQSYDLLAWGHFQQGDVKEALQIARDYIENKTYEPDALYHLGLIYKANGMDAEAKQYLEQAEKSSFELGPAIATAIKNHLKS